MIAVGRNTMTKAVIDADIEPPRGALGPKAPSFPAPVSDPNAAKMRRPHRGVSSSVARGRAAEDTDLLTGKRKSPLPV
jgi:hypothetical protein